MNTKKQSVTLSFVLRPVEILINNFFKYFLIFLPIWVIATFSYCLVKFLYQDIIQKVPPEILVDLVLTPFAAFIFFKISSHFLQIVKLKTASRESKLLVVFILSLFLGLIICYEYFLDLLYAYSFQFIFSNYLTEISDLNGRDYYLYLYSLNTVQLLLKSLIYLPVLIGLFSYIHKQTLYDKELFSIVKMRKTYLLFLTFLFLAANDWFKNIYHMALQNIGFKAKATDMLMTKLEIYSAEIFNFFFYLTPDFINVTWQVLYFGWMYFWLFQIRTQLASNS